MKPCTIKYFLLSAVGSEVLNDDARKQDFVLLKGGLVQKSVKIWKCLYE